MQKPLVVIGIDAALAETGVGILKLDERGEISVVTWGWVKTSSGMPLAARVVELHDWLWKKMRNHLCSGTTYDVAGTQVVIEKTDYSPGRADTRERWIREARAREALAVGVTTAILACNTLGIAPALLGPNEWQKEFGVDKPTLRARWDAKVKEQVAWMVAQQFPLNFRVEWKKLKNPTPTARERMTILAADVEKEVRVPTHVTDALGMAFVQLNRLQRQIV